MTKAIDMGRPGGPGGQLFVAWGFQGFELEE